MAFAAQAAHGSGGPPKITAGVLPIAYMVERITGNDADITVLVAQGQDPHTFEPTPKLVAKMVESDLLFKTGFGFEDALIKKLTALSGTIQIVDVQQGIQLRESEEDGDHKHSHKAVKRPHHDGASDFDPHTWLDPVFAKQIAANIADALIQRDPTKAELYRSNLAQLDSDLDAVHAKLEKILEPLKGRKFYVYHPAYGYFGARYGLKQVAIQSGGKEPTAKQVAKLITSAKKDGVRIIFVQPQFSQKTADAIAKEINGAVVPLDDLAKDYLKNFEDMAVKLEQALIQ